MTAKSISPLDASAVGLSTACLAHCLALPMLGVALPVLGVLGEQEWLHKSFVLLALPITGFAIWRSLRADRFWGFAVTALAGLALLLAGAFVERWEMHETMLTVIGALVLAAAHLWRWRRHA